MSNRNTKRSNKGFSLVEIIVVLVIMAILAAISIPSLVGFIDESKNQQYILEARELMVATQAGVEEAYAFDSASFGRAVRDSVNPNVKEPYGYFANNTLYLAQQGKQLDVNKDITKEKGAAAKNTIAKKLVKYADSIDYKFMETVIANNGSVDNIGDKVAFYVCFNEGGRVIYMQYARNGHLVTYTGSQFVCKTGKNLKFDAYRN